MTYFTMYSYNFCWPVRTLAERDERGTLTTPDAGDGGGAGRPCLDDAGMGHDAVRSTTLRHHRIGVWVGVVARRASAAPVNFGILGRSARPCPPPTQRPAPTMPARQAAPKPAYRIRNWKQYNDALVRRGSLTLWVDQDTLRAWRYQGPSPAGCPVPSTATWRSSAC